MAALLEPNSRLRELNIGGNYGTADPMLPFTHPDNLAKAVKKLEVVHLEGVNLTVEQLEEVMEEALDKNSNTEVLDLSYNGELDKVGKELKEKVTFVSEETTSVNSLRSHFVSSSRRKGPPRLER